MDVLVLLSRRSRGVMKVLVTVVGAGVTLVPMVTVGTGVMLVPVVAVGTGVMLVPVVAIGTGVKLLPMSCRGRVRLCRRDSSRDEELRVFSSHTNGSTQDTAFKATSGEGTGVAVPSSAAGSDLPASMGGDVGGPCSCGAGDGDLASSGVSWQGREPAPLSPDGGSGSTGLQEKSAGATCHLWKRPSCRVELVPGGPEVQEPELVLPEGPGVQGAIVVLSGELGVQGTELMMLGWPGVGLLGGSGMQGPGVGLLGGSGR